MKRSITLGAWLVASVVATVGVAGPSPEAVTPAETRRLEEANPVRPLPAIPAGLGYSWAGLENAPTPESVRLGRWLFFDTRMSLDDSVSCATCHRPEHAFSEPTAVSTGINGQKGGRKAPTFINAAFAFFPHTFWDGRAGSLEDQAKGPITNPIEMGMPDHELVVRKIGSVTGYRKYFNEVFGDDEVTIDRIARAIADYERTRLSGNSAWDRWRAAMTEHDRQVIETLTADDSFGEVEGPRQFKDGPHLGAQAKLGHVLFFNKAGCAQCHAGPNFSDSLFHNLGVGWDADKKRFKDVGRYEVSGKAEDRGAFKTPTVREITKRGPYMHDGSEQTLEAVVEFYNKGGVKNPHLSPKMKPLNLTEQEAAALVQFMKALEGEGYADEAPRRFPR